MTNVFDELKWRGLVAQTTDEQELRAALGSQQMTVYCGFDPSAASLHFGNLVQLIVLRHLQRAGHRVIVLVGGSTGQIGDPRPTAERTLRDESVTADYVRLIQKQVRPFLHFSGDNPAILVNNLDWTQGISALEFLRSYGKYFRVNVMMKKDAVAARLASESGISYTEFSYQILQALDYLHLFRDYGCTLQTGGSDQWGNLTAGVDLVRQIEGASVGAMTTPLITDASGQKYGKSEGNAVWLAAEMYSPYAFYQYWLNLPDADVGQALRVFTDRSRAEIADLVKSSKTEPWKREAQRTIAADVTTLVHGQQATAAVIAASQALFGTGDLHSLDGPTLLDATAELEGAQVSAGLPVVEAMIATGLAQGRKEARRFIKENAVSINNVKITDSESTVDEADFLGGVVAILKRGRKTMVALRLER